MTRPVSSRTGRTFASHQRTEPSRHRSRKVRRCRPPPASATRVARTSGWSAGSTRSMKSTPTSSPGSQPAISAIDGEIHSITPWADALTTTSEAFSAISRYWSVSSASSAAARARADTSVSSESTPATSPRSSSSGVSRHDHHTGPPGRSSRVSYSTGRALESTSSNAAFHFASSAGSYPMSSAVSPTSSVTSASSTRPTDRLVNCIRRSVPQRDSVASIPSSSDCSSASCRACATPTAWSCATVRSRCTTAAATTSPSSPTTGVIVTSTGTTVPSRRRRSVSQGSTASPRSARTTSGAGSGPPATGSRRASDRPSTSAPP